MHAEYIRIVTSILRETRNALNQERTISNRVNEYLIVKAAPLMAATVLVVSVPTCPVDFLLGSVCKAFTRPGLLLHVR
jgi:hypothetical protein